MVDNLVNAFDMMKKVGLVSGSLDHVTASALLGRLEREGMRPPAMINQFYKLEYRWENEDEDSQLPNSKR